MFGGMFDWNAFNKDISDWDVSNVTNMGEMFSHSKFTGDISKWNVSNVTDMHEMFFHSKFNESNISKWKIRPDCDTTNMFGKKDS